LPAFANARDRRLFVGYFLRVIMQASPDSAGEIFVIEDDAGARTTLSDALTLAGYEVICFADGNGLLARARVCTPLCVFLDVGDRDKCLFSLLDRIRAENLRAPVFAISAAASIPLAVDAVRRGAYDFIAKPFDSSDLVARVHAAIVETCSHGESPTKSRSDAGLTPREWEVLEWIARGESNKQIARRFGLSSRTVEDYRANILRKTGVGSTTELVRWMFDQPRSS
jgi:FixJ family two-component response regulator